MTDVMQRIGPKFYTSWRRVKLACTFPWLLAIVRPQWADFARAGELAKAHTRGR